MRANRGTQRLKVSKSSSSVSQIVFSDLKDCLEFEVALKNMSVYVRIGELCLSRTF